eukprot:13161981-Ditylum_brightwellii.AAC.1
MFRRDAEVYQNRVYMGGNVVNDVLSSKAKCQLHKELTGHEVISLQTKLIKRGKMEVLQALIEINVA